MLVERSIPILFSNTVSGSYRARCIHRSSSTGLQLGYRMRRRFSRTAAMLVMVLLATCATAGWGQTQGPGIWTLPPGNQAGVYPPAGGAPMLPGPLPGQPPLGTVGPPPPPGLVIPAGAPAVTNPTGEVGTTVGSAVIDEEVLAVPADTAWYAPPQWFGWEIWDVSFEIGLNGTEGNSQSVSFQTGGDLTRENETGKLDLEAKYFRTQADGIESQNNGWFKSRYDWKLGKSPWTLYTKTELYYDEFKVFDLRLVLNGGLGYQWIKTDATSFATRLGAGASREFGGVDDDWAPEANIGLDYEHQLTKVQKLTATIDYYPEFGDFSSYRVVADIGWQLVIDAEANLSLKLGILDQYDSTPNGAEPNDLNYTMLMIWKK